ncbi:MULTISPECIES: FAD:protein FMN transferase [Streptomyces]|uniref:FAD:protein FMN transferase n=1 Tax=Streptomyces lonegramiae TaxID=3075524 RepID=A0ABU2XH54_9ACTN|nr:FAD:protein FMN transferase [Streptomyces sp. DSM 41529]MDT0545255.1 FAD:protein FMN transferase [Streptomyces sp. DSM 41529]
MDGEPRRMLHVEETMGTVFSLDVREVADADRPRVRAALDGAAAWLHRVDELFSTWRPDSQISRLHRGELDVSQCDADVRDVLRLCEEAERLSDGWFSTRHAGRVDPTGLVKGWAVERAAQMLASAGAGSVCVNGGGDIQTHGGPWRVGIADPLRPGELIAVVEARDELAVATSGPAERGCHILDPYTGGPPAEPLASVTVVCRSLTDADAWATAACAMGAERARPWLQRLPDAAAFAVTADGATWQTSGFARYDAAMFV